MYANICRQDLWSTHPSKEADAELQDKERTKLFIFSKSIMGEKVLI